QFPPTANADTYSVNQDTQLTKDVAHGVLASDTGNPAPTVKTSDATSSQGGTVSVASTGSFTYTPTSGYVGDDTFHYTATNGIDPDSTATVTIHVLDTTAPDTSIDSHPSDPTNSASGSMTFSGTDNATPPGSLTFQCQVD